MLRPIFFIIIISISACYIFRSHYYTNITNTLEMQMMPGVGDRAEPVQQR